MTSQPPADVVVVGGGVIGLTVAWRVAASGRSVTVVDPEPGHGATWAAAGMLGPAGEAHFGETALTELNVAAAQAWPDFAHQLEEASGRPIDFRPTGTLMVAADPSDRAAVGDLFDYHRSLGLEVRKLTAAECREAEPLLAPGVGAGVDLAGDHQVDNRRLVDALVEAGRQAAVRFVGDEATAFATDAGALTGVVLRHGDRIRTGTAVLAAGCYSDRIAGVPEAFRPPVRPVPGLTLRLSTPDDALRLRRTVRGLVHGRSCYLVPRSDGGVVVGATMDERGFDLSVRAGAVASLLDDARRLVPAVDEFELHECATGLRPGSPDNAPVVGHGGLDGLLMATGHYRNGILQAPVTATEILRLLDSGRAAPPFDRFGPERFVGAGRAPVGGGDG